MHSGIEFHGRLSRSDRRPANPGQYDLLFQIFPKPKSQRVLWSETVCGVEVRSGGFFDVVLGSVNPIDANLFAQTPRWLGVCVVRSGRPDRENASRIPLLGDGVRLHVRLVELSTRLTHLENVFIGEDATSRGNRLRALPRRIQQLYTDLRRIQERLSVLEGADEFSDLARQLTALSAELARLSAPSGRLTRIEDELEDLVGPQGDVVDLSERMDSLEKRILVGTGAGSDALAELITSFQGALEEMAVRQTRLERLIAQLQDPGGGQHRALTSTLPIARHVPPGTVVVVQSGTVVPSQGAQAVGVLGTILAVDGAQARVAIGGVASCRVTGPVEVGDVLVTSAEPGVAQASSADAPIGIAIARALEPNDSGSGTILTRLL